ncbi:autotransporter outer membrane beta-barrel domain-containing protein [Bradyrhizobium sp. BR 10289]|uniref:autotransporter outer membrane beta-barrel domain-containing protein n=1 Tax=Bradyrhizobium sp. BR 10289 TaxID=2749993 RepID=UPI001C651B9B|nr:autotransporter outer membrane beta-barrel domain-containing protein [Bradyrhizobium sp. BR 10289]MBW7971841.1 hypothetical protein [Bradyrhizobium sp. BR 10289]
MSRPTQPEIDQNLGFDTAYYYGCSINLPQKCCSIASARGFHGADNPAIPQSGEDTKNTMPLVCCVRLRTLARQRAGFQGADLKTLRFGLASSSIALGLLCVSIGSAQAQSVQQLVVNNVIENILQNVRDQIQGRKLARPPGVMRFSAEVDEFDNHNPFGSRESDDPFHALGYAKSPIYTKAAAAPAIPAWIYGINVIGSYDRSNSTVGSIDTYTAVGAFDVTKIGIFTATDALTFVATGTHSWSHYFGTDITTPSGSGTLAYTNGGFSADFTASASWSRVSSIGIVAPGGSDSSSMSYTGNAQYKFDFPYTVFFEPTVGVTYTENYTANFGAKTSDSTEVHGGARMGFETKWIGYTIQPSWSVVAMKIVDQSGVGAVGGIGLVPGAGGIPVPAAASTQTLGGRASAKVNVIWTQAFSSYLEAHATEIAGTTTAGAQAGLRYTW